MSKYYTPELEEFHVGFECEVVQEANWVNVEIIDSNMGYFERRLNEGESLRVKYLDREDIESLGFEWQSGSDSSVDYFLLTDISVYLTHIPYRNEVIIQVRIDGMLDRDINSLIIKNKSELKFILKCIGVL